MRTRIALAATLCGMFSVACGPGTGELIDELLNHHGLPPDEPSDSAYEVLDGGYVRSGDWAGYAWVAADEDSTVSPGDFADIAAGEDLCITGTVAAEPEYMGHAILGLNLNQSEANEAPGTWEVTSAGVHYQLSNPGGSMLRMQLHDASGEIWCAHLEGDEGTFAWSDFRTQCWDYESGEAYDGSTPLERISFLVPGSDTVDLPFDFCLESIEPTNDVPEVPSQPAVCADPTGAGSSELAEGFAVEPGGYVTSGDIHGWSFIWSSFDANYATAVVPEDFSAHPGDAPLCASGVVAASPDYSQIAMLGVNLNQAQDSDGEPGVLTPTGDGLAYDISDCVGTSLRLEIHGANGDDDENSRFCAYVGGGQGFIAWSEFNTECWINGGLYYDGTMPLQSAFVVVPGMSNADVPFDFCLNGLAIVTN